MYRLLILVFLFPLLSMKTCSKVEVETAMSKKFEGKWVLENVFLGDAIDTPCSWEAKEHRDMFITLLSAKEIDGKQTYSLNGESTINLIFGNITIESFDVASKIASIKLGPLGATKMAGPDDQLQCEYRFFTLLNESVEMRLEGENLLIGRFKKDTTPSRDGGTYLIFKKGK